MLVSIMFKQAKLELFIATVSDHDYEGTINVNAVTED